jgi:hypothetical protein
MSDDETTTENQQTAEKTKLSRLEEIRKKIEQLRAREAREAARKRTRERKEASRRKILYGVVLVAMERDGMIDPNLLQEGMDKYITADRDRIFLGLEPRGETAQEQASSAPAPTKEQQPEVEKSKSGYRPGSFEVHPDTEDL